jgi:hypothetical protein
MIFQEPVAYLTLLALACGGAPRSGTGSRVASGGDSLTPQQKESLLALVRYDTAPPVPQAQASDTAAYTVSKPVVIANIAYAQADVDADTNQGIIEVVGDFDTYLHPIADSLQRLGVGLESANARVIRVHVGAAWYTFSFITPGGRVGYVLAAPGRVPQLLTGVRTDFDLPKDMRAYLKSGAVQPK